MHAHVAFLVLFRTYAAVKHFPIKSDTLYVVISKMGYQSPRSLERTFSVMYPGNIERVTMYIMRIANVKHRILFQTSQNLGCELDSWVVQRMPVGVDGGSS